jgi:hypothetical protein
MQTHFLQDLGSVRIIADSLMMYSTRRLRILHFLIARLGCTVAMPYLESSSDRPMFSTKLLASKYLVKIGKNEKNGFPLILFCRLPSLHAPGIRIPFLESNLTPTLHRPEHYCALLSLPSRICWMDNVRLLGSVESLPVTQIPALLCLRL